VRTDRLCNYKESGPCVDCLKVIQSLNIKRIVFSVDENTACICKPCEYVSTHETLGRRSINNNRTT
jgi:hypothetical protein